MMLVSRGQLEWATRAGVPIGDALAPWLAAELLAIPVGASWDVLRMAAEPAHDAVNALLAGGEEFGPFLETEQLGGVLEFVVPRGSAAAWVSLDGTWCTARGALRCPPPWCTGSVEGRRWIVAPPVPVVTDVSALRAAYITAQTRRWETAKTALWAAVRRAQNGANDA